MSLAHNNHNNNEGTHIPCGNNNHLLIRQYLFEIFTKIIFVNPRNRNPVFAGKNVKFLSVNF